MGFCCVEGEISDLDCNLRIGNVLSSDFTYVDRFRFTKHFGLFIERAVILSVPTHILRLCFNVKKLRHDLDRKRLVLEY